VVQIDDLVSALITHNYKDRALLGLHSIPDQRRYPGVQRLLRHPRGKLNNLEEKFGDRQAA